MVEVTATRAGDALDARADLVARATHGDTAAFASIVRLHDADMTRVCFVICGDLDLAEEAVAEAWPLVWRRLGSLRDPDRLRPWLVSVAANQARQLLRQRRRRAVVELAVAERAEQVEKTAARQPGSWGSAADLDLANALGRLKPEDRALLALRYVAGFDATELGRAFGLTPSGTRVRMARLLDRLRRELGDD
jgi:RNA polymerase sigma-70 factor (ECF subfamily)